MKGYRFFADAGENRSKSASKRHMAWTVKNIREFVARGAKGNCVAVFLDDNGRPSWIPGGDSCECFASVFSYDNSDVNVCGVSREYLRKHCTRIPEELARQWHPRLFARLDMA